MRVAMYYNNRDVRLEELPVPSVGAGELLVKVIASGICGSDVMEWYRIKKAPRVLGHEIAGEIVAVGEGVDNYRLGDRVFVSHHVPCNTCRYCLNGQHTVCDTLLTTNFDPGGFAEYLRVPRINVDRGIFSLPDEVTFEDGVFVEPLACVVRAHRLARLQPGQTVLVLGSGIAGVLNIALARATGAGRIIATDVSPYRLEMARRLGADVTIHAGDDVPGLVRKANQWFGANVVVVCTGAPAAFAQAIASVDRGGTILLFAPSEPGVELPIPSYDFWRHGITLLPTYGGAPLDIQVAIDLIRAGRLPLRQMVTHRLALAETGLGFQLVASSGESMKVIVEPHR